MEIRPNTRPKECPQNQGGVWKREKSYKCGSQPPTGGGSKQCSCSKKPCCPPVECKRKTRYIQPPRPKDFAPIRVYKRPEKPIESCTIYRKSYLPVEGERQAPIRPSNNLGLSCDMFSTDTIQKMSYQPICDYKRAGPILPCNHDLGGHGPMQEVTTQRHDYVPKPHTKSEAILPSNNIFLNGAPLSDQTTCRMSYMPVCGERTEPILPKNLIEKPCGPFACNTVQKMSFQPVPIPRKEFLPWAQKGKYSVPDKRMEGCTIYRKSYCPIDGYQREGPILPKPGLVGGLGTGCHFEDQTIQKLSYQGVEGNHKPALIMPHPNIMISNKPMEEYTTQKLSYQPICDYKRAGPILPCNHDLGGHGPMQEITSQRHDYVPKEIDRTEPILPRPNLFCSDQPLSDKTTNRLSYLPNCSVGVTEAIRPTNMIHKPCGPFETNTIQKMSYQPVCIPEKVDMPWAEKKKYTRPTTRISDNTVYRMSYDPPGEFMDDGDDDCGCHCAYENECCPCPCPPTATVC